MPKNLITVATLSLLLTCCERNDIKPSSVADPVPIEAGEFIFGRTTGPIGQGLQTYNVFKISGSKLYGTYVRHNINPDSLELYPMQMLSSEKYVIASTLPSLLPGNVFSETKTLIGLMNIDTGYDFVRVSTEAGATKFFYIGDAGYPEYISAFKQALDQDLSELRQ